MKQKLVVLSGAGVSAESGLRTFRDSDGLWEGYNVQDVATPEAWASDPELVIDFYNMRRRDIANAQPNAAHKGIAWLQNHFDVTVITQNIDDLHERAGSGNVLHLHGEIFRMCSENNRSLTGEIRNDMQYGMRARDGGNFRPDIVWFGEAVPMIEPAAIVSAAADIYVVIGTSLQVYPAAGLIRYASGHSKKFIIDRKIPGGIMIPHISRIEKPATEGIIDLIKLLLPEIEIPVF